MTRHLLPLIALAALAGCLDYTPMYKVGAPLAATESVRAQCTADATLEFPVNLIREVEPIFDDDGNVIGYSTTVFDINEGRRVSAARACMQAQGYQRVTIPYCEDAQIAGRAYRPLTIAPPLSDSICALRQPGGQRALIDLGRPAG
ncbi:hypothetical protein [Shimia sp.]|uniref:hypothetical protein n=1 Tax=Shimia sp. TaxID=1954381 RepID=UPI003568F830